MPRQFQFAIREALSDVSGMKVLAEAGSAYPVMLSYPVAASAALAVLDQFITPAPLPNQTEWVAGEYTASLLVVGSGPDVSFTVDLWRADSLGNLIQQLGTTPSIQSAGSEQVSPDDPQAFTFLVSGQDLVTNSTDRLVLRLFAQNASSTQLETLSIMASQSGAATPITAKDVATNASNPFRRNKFLGFLWRRGDGARFFDKNGVNIDTGNNY